MGDLIIIFVQVHVPIGQMQACFKAFLCFSISLDILKSFSIFSYQKANFGKLMFPLEFIILGGCKANLKLYICH